MIRNITICCQDMLAAIANEHVMLAWEWKLWAGPDKGLRPAIRIQSASNPAKHCPWCGKELPFSYEEERPV